MQDDPSLDWQQEQMEKMINRQGAAKGRWGGGATAREMNRETAGLLSQDYANRFSRGRQERDAAVGAERDRYGRSLTGLDIANRAEASDYDRATSQYGMDVAREQDAYGRSLTDTNLANQAARDMYDQAQYGYQTGVDREADAYGRATDMYDRESAREQGLYGRALKDYEIRGENIQNELNQKTAMANYGPRFATAMSNAALGQGTALSDLSIQQGNVAAASTMAQGTPWGNAFNLGKEGLKMYLAAK
jgi:hypothetical protein